MAEDKNSVIKAAETGFTQGLTIESLLEQYNGDMEAIPYNTRQVLFSRDISPTTRIHYSDIPEMRKRFYHYLDMCAKYDIKPGNQSACYAIGITPAIANGWLNPSSGYPERQDFIREMKSMLAMYRENAMADGKINPIVGIFWQKNYDGLRDIQEYSISQENVVENRSEEDLKKRYENVVDVEFEKPQKAKKKKKSDGKPDNSAEK